MGFLEQQFQRVKNGIHGVQGLGILVGWVITIAVFTKSGKTGGQTKYYFALCWVTIPVLIYQTAVPIFNRTKRFSNAYAHAVLDILFTTLWLAAFAAVAAWTNQGINDVKDRKGAKGCDKFAYGTTGKCKLSQGSVGCGVIVCLLFVATSALSVWALLYYRRNGSLPGVSSSPGAVPITDHAFSSNPNDDDPFEHDDLHNADDHQDAYDPHMSGGRGGRDDDEYHSIHTDTEEGTHLGRPLSWGQHQQPQHTGPSEIGHEEEDTSYHGAYSQHPASSTQFEYNSQSHPPPAQDPFRNPSPYRQPSPLSTHEYGGAAPQLPPLGGAGDPFRDDLALSHDHGGYGGNSGRVDIPDASDYRPGSRLA